MSKLCSMIFRCCVSCSRACWVACRCRVTSRPTQISSSSAAARSADQAMWTSWPSLHRQRLSNPTDSARPKASRNFSRAVVLSSGWIISEKYLPIISVVSYPNALRQASLTCRNWPSGLSAQMRSGEKLTMVFNILSSSEVLIGVRWGVLRVGANQEVLGNGPF